MSTSPGIDYLRLSGIESVTAATCLVIFYGAILFLFMNACFSSCWMSYSDGERPFNAVSGLLSLFCAIRITGFIIRLDVAKPGSAGPNLGLLVGDEILFDVGFAVLLYSAYILSSHALVVSDIFVPTNIIDVCLVVGWGLFEFAMITAMVLSITGAIQSHSTNPHIADLGKNLQKASTIILLVLTVLQTYLTLKIIWVTLSFWVGVGTRARGPQKSQYLACYIRYFVSFLLLMREAFATAAVMGDTAKLNNEHLWYPLIVLPEALAMMLSFFGLDM